MEQVIIGGHYNLTHVNNTEYIPIMGGNTTWHGSAAARMQVIPTSGTLKNLRIELNDVPGTGTYTFTLHRGVGIGVPANTALTCTVGAAATQANDMVNEVAVAAGDVICLQCDPTNPDNARYVKWSMVFEGDTANESIMLVTGSTNVSANRYCRPMGGGSLPTENDVRCVCPTAGTIKNLYVWLINDPGNAPDAYRFTLRIDGASQTLTVTITANDRTGNDVAHPIAVSAGDVLTIMFEPLNTPGGSGTMTVGMTFVADTDGESLILGGSNDDLHNVNTEYYYLLSPTDVAWTATEAQRYQLAQECTLKKLYVLLSGEPTAGSDYVFTVRQNAASPGGGLSVTIADAATTGNDTTNSIAVSNDDELDMEVNPDDTPTVRDAYWGMVCFTGEVVTFIPTVTII